jgi:hypothetical protein
MASAGHAAQDLVADHSHTLDVELAASGFQKHHQEALERFVDAAADGDACDGDRAGTDDGDSDAESDCDDVSDADGSGASPSEPLDRGDLGPPPGGARASSSDDEVDRRGGNEAGWQAGDDGRSRRPAERGWQSNVEAGRLEGDGGDAVGEVGGQVGDELHDASASQRVAEDQQRRVRERVASQQRNAAKRGGASRASRNAVKAVARRGRREAAAQADF